MTREELKKLREDFLLNNSEQLKSIYLDYREDITRLLRVKMNISLSKAEDVFSDALLVFRQNVISGKIKNLSSVKAYLSSTCMNMVRESWNYSNRRLKKEAAVRLLLYDNSHKEYGEADHNELMLEVSQRAFRMLSKKCQRILVAFYVYKVPMKEIAEELEFASADVAKMTKARCFRTWLKNIKVLMPNDI